MAPNGTFTLPTEDEAWGDEYAIISVYYDSHSRAAMKMMEIRVPPWRVKAGQWLDLLRGLVG